MWRDDGPRDSANPLRSLFDAAARGYAIQLTCRGCGRSAILDPHAVWHHFQRKHLSDRLRDVPKKCRCRDCGRRGPEMDLVHKEPTDTSLPMPLERDWKAELRRHR